MLNVISRSPSQLQPVLDAIALTAQRLCQSDDVFIMLLRDGLFRLAAAHDASAEHVRFLRENPLALGRGSVSGRVALERRTVEISDVLADPEFTQARLQRMGGFRTALGVPLLREGNVIGVIVLTRKAVKPFDKKQIDLVTTFADQAVIAINNVRLFEEVQARTRELQQALDFQTATSEVLNAISRAPAELQPVLDAIVGIAARLCEAEYALVYKLCDGRYRLAAANNAEAEFVKYAIEHPLAPGRGSLVGRTALEGHTIHMPDCLADPEYEVLEYQKVGKYRTTLGVPLIRGGLTIGVSRLMRSVVKPFTDKQIELVADLRRSGGDRDQQCRPFRGGAGADGGAERGAGAADRDGRGPEGHQPVGVRSAIRARYPRQLGGAALRRREGVLFERDGDHIGLPPTSAFRLRRKPSLRPTRYPSLGPAPPGA